MRLISSPVNGFCNRLKGISSCYILAKECGRKFEIMWHPDDDVHMNGVKGEDLFEYDKEIMPLNDVDFNWDYIRGCGLTHFKLDSINDRVFIQAIEQQMADWILNSKDKDIIVLGGGNMKLPHVSWSEFNKNKREYYNNLPIKKNIRKKNRRIPYEL